jgi:probable DNA metabolism protein
MLVYLYDGSYEGLLTAVATAFSQREQPDDYQQRSGQAQNWLDTCREIQTDLARASRVYQAIRSRISPDACEAVTRAFLSSIPGKDLLIDRYLRLGFRLGDSVDNHLHLEPVRRMFEVNRTVGREIHRFHGLMRFVQTANGIYYACFEPDHNITMLVAPHFADRLSDQPWIIHDTRRGLAALFNTHTWILSDYLPDDLSILSDKETLFQQLWQTYSHSIAIAERTNKRLQRSFMPMRYWQNLNELGKF